MLTEKWRTPMRLVIKIAATLLILAGIMWFLQGVNVLPGSFMTGQTKWAIIGAVAIVAGIVAWVLAARRR
jgi:TRAP-type mannitol/chloroaromatic compound transport system permease small subunit